MQGYLLFNRLHSVTAQASLEKKKGQHYLINDGFQITPRERIAAFSVFVSPYVAM